MTISISSPVNGAAQTGLTSPTYTLVSDVAPNAFTKQLSVSALGGTQTGVDVGSASKPFTISVARPSVFRQQGVINSQGVLVNVPSNVWRIVTRKGLVPLAGQSPLTRPIETVIPVPAGVDIADPANLRAALSLHIGVLSQISASLGDSLINGTL